MVAQGLFLKGEGDGQSGVRVPSFGFLPLLWLRSRRFAARGPDLIFHPFSLLYGRLGKLRCALDLGH